MKRSLFLMVGICILLASCAKQNTKKNESIPDPVLAFTGTEDSIVDGQQFTEYHFNVLNRNVYPAELFVASPNLPPCGLNTNSSRTWVDIFKPDGTYLYGFCALSQPEDLKYLWFGLPKGNPPPSAVYITLTDRLFGITYKSNLAKIEEN